ncbi:hypothetical protein N0V93_001240 [Gnomoniopsis smithogilvyi]|uniref:Uncharacterized protein n=1 Tax=Gnomoniopsis smithogilvyi TaxID=1191159 RepID=A0A9W8Z190_9PEZI|nr:hypothetical protein N0V93_001240 [Gnomoniopsis smithogilvyi]
MDDQEYWDVDPYIVEERELPLRIDGGPMGVTMDVINILMMVCSICAVLVLPAVIFYMGFTTFREGRRLRREEMSNDARCSLMERTRQAARMKKLAAAKARREQRQAQQQMQQQIHIAEEARNDSRLRGARGQRKTQEKGPVAREILGQTPSSGRKESSIRKESSHGNEFSSSRSQSIKRPEPIILPNPLGRAETISVVESLVIDKSLKTIDNSLKTLEVKIDDSPKTTTIVTLVYFALNNIEATSEEYEEEDMSMATIMTTFAPPPATDKTASKLLPPKRRRRIEIWLDEAMTYEAQQNCAFDKRHSHYLDIQSSQTQYQIQKRFSMTSTVCDLCGRYFEGEGPPMAATDTSGQPSDTRVMPKNSKSMLRGLKSAMAALMPNNNIIEDGFDPSLTTKMYLVTSADDDENGSDKSSSNARLGSSDNNDNGNKTLEEKMARLKRAQKLLEKSQPKSQKE